MSKSKKRPTPLDHLYSKHPGARCGSCDCFVGPEPVGHCEAVGRRQSAYGICLEYRGHIEQLTLTSD